MLTHTAWVMIVRNSLHRQRAHYVKNKPNLVTNSLHVCWGLLSYKYANIILRLACYCNNIYIEIGARRPSLNSHYYYTVQTSLLHSIGGLQGTTDRHCYLCLTNLTLIGSLLIFCSSLYFLWGAVWTSFYCVFVILVNMSRGFKIKLDKHTWKNRNTM